MIDLQQWDAQNRAKLFPGKIQHWTVLGTLADHPSKNFWDDDELATMLGAFLVRTFEGVSFSPTVLAEEMNVNAAVSSIKMVEVKQERLSWLDVLQRRETLPYGPMPTVRSPAVWIRVSFAYYGQETSIPWPVRNSSHSILGVSSKDAVRDPIGADWVLDSVSEPGGDAPATIPLGKAVIEKTTGEIVDIAATIIKPLTPILILGGAIAAGVLILSRRR